MIRPFPLECRKIHKKKHSFCNWMPLESARAFKWRPSTRVESSSSNELGQTRMRSATQRRRGIGLFVDGAATRRWPIGSRSMRPSSGCCAKPKRFPRSIATSDDARSPTLPKKKKAPPTSCDVENQFLRFISIVLLCRFKVPLPTCPCRLDLESYKMNYS